MPSHKVELSSMTNVDTRQRRAGCYVNVLTGFVLVVLAAAVTVGVALLVHFMGAHREVSCQCRPVSCPSDVGEVLPKCLQIAGTGHADICRGCQLSQNATELISSSDSNSSRTASIEDGDSHLDTPTTATPTTYLRTTTSPPSFIDLSTERTTALLPKVVATTPGADTKVEDIRLPSSVYPVHYNLVIQTYLGSNNTADLRYKGSVTVWVKCTAATENVTLHSSKLRVTAEDTHLYAEDPGQDDPAVVAQEEDEAREFLIIKLNSSLQVNKTYVLELSFNNSLSNEMKGFYYSHYESSNRNAVYFASTQFQSTYARKAFPCFDEPALKSTFNVTLIRAADLMSLSNMDVIDSSHTFVEDNVTYVKDVYATTPLMSNYLLAFTVGQFDSLGKTTRNGVQFRTWSRPVSLNSTRYALEIGTELLEFFEDYCNYSYHLSKLDMISFPEFIAGGMENWGLITYRDLAMLYEEGVTSQKQKDFVARVISHELAHQWFGNLVTLKWWDDTWLNEGFASYLQNVGVEYIHPDWDIFNSFVVKEMFPLMMTDSADSTRPVFYTVNTTDGIQAMFDEISYEKGSSLIRMMSHFIGLDTFKMAMRTYLSRKAFQTVHHDDLYEVIDQQLKLDNKTLDIKQVMDTWILQMNYPLVTVKRVNKSRTTVHITQERFLDDRASVDPRKPDSPFNYTWAIPFTLTSSEVINSQGLTNPDIYWIGRNETNKILELKDGLVPRPKRGWILANVDHVGYYRVNYDAENWKALCAQLMANHTVIPVIHRAQIINDAWALEKNEYLPIDVAMATLDYLHKERDHLVWTAASNQLDHVLSMLAGGRLHQPFMKLMRSKIEKLYPEFDMHNLGQTYQEIATSSKIFHLSSKFGVRQFMSQAHSLFTKWMNNSKVNPIDPNLRSSVYCSAVAYGGYEECQFLFDMYRASKDTYERNSLFQALFCTDVPWILNSLLTMTLKPIGLFNNHTVMQLIKNVADNPVGRTMAWNFYRANFDRLQNLYGDSVPSLIYSMVTNLNREHELYEVEIFEQALHIKKPNSLTRTVKQNIRWITRNENILDDLLKSKTVPGV